MFIMSLASSPNLSPAGEFDNLNELPTYSGGIDKRLLDLLEECGLSIHSRLSDREAATLAFEYIRKHTDSNLYYSLGRGQFISFNRSKGCWRVGKEAGALELLSDFTHWLRDAFEYYKSRHEAIREEGGKLLFDPTKTEFGKLSRRYLSMTGLENL